MFAYAIGLLLPWVLALGGVDLFDQWLEDPTQDGWIRRETNYRQGG
jgi:hypothetical protein